MARTFSPATAAYLANRASYLGHILVWLSARNRGTGEVETIGIWTGADHQDFAIGGDTRRYYGAGAALLMDPIRRQTGLKVRTQRITFSQVAPEVLQALRVYDPRRAPIEVHRALFDPITEELVDEPHEIFSGFINKAPLPTPPKGERGEVKIEAVTHARALTIPLSRSRSDATLRARSPGDAFRQYASITEAVDTPWGREASSGQPAAAAINTRFGKPIFGGG